MAAAGSRAFAWQAFPPMPTCRVYGTVAHQDGHLLVLGGCGRAGLPLNTAETLDMASHTWLALAPLPTARAGAAAVVLGKQVLVVGGVDEGQSPVAAVEAFLADQGGWERRAALPQAAMGIATVERGPLTCPQLTLKTCKRARTYSSEKMVWCMRWAAWAQTQPPRPRCGCTSPGRTAGSRCLPCPRPATGLPPSCTGTRSTCWGAARASFPWPLLRPLTWRPGPGPGTRACPAAGPLLAVPWPTAASSAWGACSSLGPTTSTRARTSSTLWRRSTWSTAPGPSCPAACACGIRGLTLWLAPLGATLWLSGALETSRARWAPRRASALPGGAGRCCLPCPRPAAPVPVCRLSLGCLSSGAWRRVPARPWRRCVCVMGSECLKGPSHWSSSGPEAAACGSRCCGSEG